MDIDCSLDLNSKTELAGIHSRHIQPHGTTIRNGTATARRFPSAPSPERADTSGSDGVAHQRAPVGDSFDDEQWSDYLLDPQSH